MSSEWNFDLIQLEMARRQADPNDGDLETSRSTWNELRMGRDPPRSAWFAFPTDTAVGRDQSVSSCHCPREIQCLWCKRCSALLIPKPKV